MIGRSLGNRALGDRSRQRHPAETKLIHVGDIDERGLNRPPKEREKADSGRALEHAFGHRAPGLAGKGTGPKAVDLGGLKEPCVIISEALECFSSVAEECRTVHQGKSARFQVGEPADGWTGRDANAA